MKKAFTIIFISFIIFTAFTARAQDKDTRVYEKSYIGLYAGISNPMSNYGSSDYNNNKAGFAKRGLTIGFDGAIYLYKNLGLGYTLTFQDQSKLNYNDTYALAQGYTTSFAADQVTVSGYDRFHNWNILIGPQYSIVYHKLVLDLRVSAGFIKVFSTPETSIDVTGVPEQKVTFYQRKASAFVAGYGANVGLRWKFSDNWGLALRGVYVSSPGPSIKTEGRTITTGRLVTKLPINEFQTTLGITLQL